jgi:hypothetical protein
MSVRDVVQRAVLLLWVTALVVLSACLDNTLEPPDGAPEKIANMTDFAHFTSWAHVDVGDGAVTGGHAGVVRTVYINQVPDDGSSEFPVGTILVKTGSGGEVTGTSGTQIHAMVKRGHGFNRDGAVGWEWFELGLSTTGEPVQIWRGIAPPAGDQYGCAPGVDCGAGQGQCNACHAAARKNDSVLDDKLLLSRLSETFASTTTVHGSSL